MAEMAGSAGPEAQLTGAEYRRQQHLDTAAQMALDTINAVSKTLSVVSSLWDYVPEEKRTQLRAAVMEAKNQASDTLRAIMNAGGASPFGILKDPPLSLAELGKMDTPEARQLLAALDDLQATADALDAKRGHVFPEGVQLAPGQPRGTGWAETLAMWRLRLSREIYGPGGRDGDQTVKAGG